MVCTLGMAAWAEDEGGEYLDETSVMESAMRGLQAQDQPADTDSSGSVWESFISDTSSSVAGTGSSDTGAGSSDAGAGSSDSETGPCQTCESATDPDEERSNDGERSNDDDGCQGECFDPEVNDPEEELPAACQVWLITADGHILLNYEAEAGTLVKEPDFTPNARKGFVFAFWYEVNGDVTPFEFNSPLNEDLVLAAYFKEAEAEEDEAEEEFIYPPLIVDISSDAGDMMYIDDVVTLTAHVSEWVEEYNCSSLWRRSDGSGWVVVATDTPTYSFVLDEENFGWTWEFLFTVCVNTHGAHNETLDAAQP